ncbi:SDR family oxidoreductase [Microbacterium sp. NPDC056234]|uniref:SDR family oxidoreductase n=1 Tax=Microbacterium sp. NPDC056234 TaxID=3345757 RepID=UPI0035D9336C
MTILVTGATGNVGRRIVAQLAERGESVRALTRHPEQAQFPEGVVAVQGDLTDLDSMRAAMDGCEAVHFITFDGATGAPLHNGTELVALAEASGVRRISVLGGWFESTLEPALRAGSIPWAQLAPVEYMTNTFDWTPEVAQHRRVRTLADWPSAMIHADDIAAVAIVLLTQDGHDGQVYYLTGPEALTPAERAARIGAALGETVEWIHLTEDEERERLRSLDYGEEYVAFGVELAKNPPQVGQIVQDTVTRLTGQPGRTFAQWARENADAFRG